MNGNDDFQHHHGLEKAGASDPACLDIITKCKPLVLRLSSPDADVWRLVLPEYEASGAEVNSILGEEEQNRSARFHKESDRQRFIWSHVGLRLILAHYVHDDPRRLQFEKGRYGKPRLVNSTTVPDIHFNLSHSGDFALVAISSGSQVGIDLEYMDTSGADLSIAKRFFSSREFLALEQLSGPDQVAGFYNCWVRKEAYVKALGGGLSLPLHEFDVSVDPNEPASLLASRINPEDPQQWNFRDISVEKGYVACLACEAST